MPLFILAMFFRAVVEAVRQRRAATRKVKSESLCADCYFAHVQYAANTRRAISCTYGGAVRPIRLDVLYCTDYRNRNLPVRAGVIGFVREIAPAE
ncbi:MAG TPA: hypothetical protein VGL74_11710 [Terriglobales bacterium]|jgi:hypothetical protein